MPKSSGIRWRKKDRQKLSNTVRQFNSKITRTLKKHPELADFLPERLSVSELTSGITSRKDFNRQINSARRFLRKGAEAPVTSKSGIKTTAWEKREVGYRVAQINRTRTAERKKANVSTYTGTMGAIENFNLTPKKYDINKMPAKSWDKFVKNTEKQLMDNYFSEKMKLYKENYIKGLRTIFGRRAEVIIEMVDNISAETMVEMYYKDPVLQTEFIYDEKELDIKFNAIIQHLNNYFE